MSSTDPSRRRALRRAVRLECELHSELWDGAVPFLVTDLSPHGLWLDSAFPLEPGSPVHVAFRPPSWPDEVDAVATAARVTRVGMQRRRSDNEARGMGLCFVDLDEVAQAMLAERLRGIPPPLPGAIAPPLRLPRAADDSAVLPLDDGRSFTFEAEGALMTAPRHPVTELPPRAGPAAAPQLFPARTARSYRYIPRSERLSGEASVRGTNVTLLHPRLRLVKG